MKIEPPAPGDIGIAVSGGADSVYLLVRMMKEYRNAAGRISVLHVNFGTRGRESQLDQECVEKLCRKHGLPLRVMKPKIPLDLMRTGFEKRARDIRYSGIKEMKADLPGGEVMTAHTADDQVETILMRFFEGAGIAGLKGIPRKTADGIARPILDVWKEDILKYLKRNKIPFRVDGSNSDTRFERNWIRHVLIPLLVARYGKEVGKRIFLLGEKFGEIDAYVEIEAEKWLKKIDKVRKGLKAGNETCGSVSGAPAAVFERKVFAGLPALLRIRILQRICFDRLGTAPNERLLKSMDRLIATGGPSAKLDIGKEAVLQCRYESVVFGRVIPRRGRPPDVESGSSRLVWETKKGISIAGAARLAAGGRGAVFDAKGLKMPLRVRPLRAGDRIRPFGLDAEKKIKEILIDRKIPRHERWGRPVVCDANGAILWVPGVLRSAHAPVIPSTREAVVLRTVPARRQKISRRTPASKA